MHRPLRWRAATALAATTFAVAIAAAPAYATPIPLGDYPCYYYAGSNYTSAGTVNIVGPGRYRINSGADGTYSHHSATNIVTFATGDYGSFYGVWNPSKPESIEIHDKTDGAYLWACNHSAGSEANYPQDPGAGAGTGGGTGTGISAQPVADLAVAKQLKLRSFLAGITAAADRAGTFTSRFTISSRDARKLRMAKSVVFATGKARLAGPGFAKIKPKLTRKAKKALRRARKLKVSIVTTFTSATGQKTVTKDRLTLRR